MRIYTLVLLLIACLNGLSLAVEGTFSQRSNGFQREPSTGPSRLRIDGDRFVLSYKEREAGGRVRGSKDLLILDLDDPQSFDSNGQCVATRFCITRLGDEVLLVDLESIAPFCNAINSHNRLGPTGTGAVILSRGATANEKEEIGELANPLITPLIVTDELLGRITHLAPKLSEAAIPGSRIGKLEGYKGKCSLGLASKVFPGMALHYSQSDGASYGIVWVTAVFEKDCTILVEQIDRGMSPPIEGTAVSLRVP